MTEHAHDVPDRTADFLGPFAQQPREYNVVQKGKCSTDSSVFSDTEVNSIAACALESWNSWLKAHFLWTAHNEIEEKWDYIKAYDLGWLNQKNQTESRE